MFTIFDIYLDKVCYKVLFIFTITKPLNSSYYAYSLIIVRRNPSCKAV